MNSKFVRGLIDGSLSTLGVVIGASTASPMVVIAAGFGGTLANGISNILGASAAERAEEGLELRKIEKAMVRKNLKNSVLHSEASKEAMKAGAFDGFATILGGSLPVLPYLLLPPHLALISSVTLVLTVLLVLGIYIGRLSRESLLFSGVKMAFFGGAVALACYIIQWFFVPQV